MKAARYYLIGLGAVAGAGLGISFLLAPGDRRAGLVVLAAGLLVQGPMGWWLLRSVGTPRFLLSWIVGMGTRVALVAMFVFGVVPVFGLPPVTALVGLVLVLLALLLIEVMVVNLGRRQAGAS